MTSPADDLVVSGGGSTAVATTELFEAAGRLERTRGLIGECLRQARAIGSPIGGGPAGQVGLPAEAVAAEQDLAAAARLMVDAIGSVERLRLALLLAAEGYGYAERAVDLAATRVAARLAAVAGRTLPVLAVLFLPTLAGAVAGAAIGAGIGVGVGAAERAILPGSDQTDPGIALGRWLRQNRAVLSDPILVKLVRLSVMSVDDFGGGLLGIPPDIVAMLGEDGAGVLGLASSSLVIAALVRPAGMLRETPVVVAERSAPIAVSRASSYADRAGRIPVGAAQVRIDRYRTPGSADRFEVYIGGTRDFSPVAGAEPWDMTSNVDALSGVDAGSVRVVREAMAQAGVTASTAVVITGYSQGGLIAAQLAASGDFDIRGLFTLGAPAGQVPVPAEIPWVAIEHTDDLVPAFGGTWASAAPVIVRRQLFAGRPVDTRITLPAHQLDAYRQTAAAADRSNERRLTEGIARLDRFGDGAKSVDSVLYRAERVASRD
jgi:hypothetical protein